ncbi:hypothetical protein HMI54_013622 [Coelomomyces lativittatus]|nr:hypothetical protein HMI55_005728 [Coelomomyces lativittatus]KAJ1497454.1 hypothetical protein HMI54_013622 [Coelomomyces lativittatus]KAJ1504935.1 hypothetical protein HMI56_001386 [Coelomomyces lativittatus]
MALTTSQKVLVWTVAVMTLAGVGYFATQHVKTLKKVNKEKKSRKRSIKSDSSASTSNTETIPITKDSAKTRKSTSDSAKKLSESAAAVVRGEKMLSSKVKEIESCCCFSISFIPLSIYIASLSCSLSSNFVFQRGWRLKRR